MKLEFWSWFCGTMVKGWHRVRGGDGTIRIYDLPSQSLIFTLQQHDIWAIAHHPMEEELAVGHNGGSVVLWRHKEMRSDWMQSIYSKDASTITGIAYCQNGT